MDSRPTDAFCGRVCFYLHRLGCFRDNTCPGTCSFSGPNGVCSNIRSVDWWRSWCNCCSCNSTREGNLGSCYLPGCPVAGKYTACPQDSWDLHAYTPGYDSGFTSNRSFCCRVVGNNIDCTFDCISFGALQICAPGPDGGADTASL